MSTTTTTTHPDGTVISCTTTAAAAPAGLKLYYFAGRGLAEIPRQMLTVAGVVFEDVQYPISKAEGKYVKPEMEAEAAKGTFAANMGRLPILEVTAADGETFSVGGSKTVARFIAATFGLNGSSPAETATIDAVCECVGDLKAAFGKVADEDKDAWFTNEAAAQGERALPWYLKSIDALMGSSGFAVGAKASMADAVLYNVLAECCTTKGIFGNPNSEPMGDLAKTNAAVEQYAPKIAAALKAFGADAKLSAYLAGRGLPAF